MVSFYGLVQLCQGGADTFYFLPLSHQAGLSMNGVRSHWHAPTHASIYLGVLSWHVQNAI